MNTWWNRIGWYFPFLCLLVGCHSGLGIRNHLDVQKSKVDSTKIYSVALLDATGNAKRETDDPSTPTEQFHLDWESNLLSERPQGSEESERLGLLKRLGNDQLQFYSRGSLTGLGLVLGSGAAMANTPIDETLQKHFQASVRGASSDEWFEYLHANKELGNGYYTLPIMGATWIAKELWEGPPIFERTGEWGERSMRGFLVGAPPMIAFQRISGGSRPQETLESSEWHPMRDNNGVSGHAFMSALPFITAAKMTESPWRKTFWYAGSLVGPLSRVNDNAHYPSQVGMGWAIAFLAANAIDHTDTGKRGWSFYTGSNSDGAAVAFEYHW